MMNEKFMAMYDESQKLIAELMNELSMTIRAGETAVAITAAFNGDGTVSEYVNTFRSRFSDVVKASRIAAQLDNCIMTMRMISKMPEPKQTTPVYNIRVPKF